MKQTTERRKILIIDDEQGVREVLAQILSEVGGHQVVSTSGGKEGCDIFLADIFDLVITDLGMPGMTGWEVAKKIRETDSDVPILLATGWGVQPDEQQIRESKINHVLSKPFRLEKVLELIHKVLAQENKT